MYALDGGISVVCLMDGNSLWLMEVLEVSCSRCGANSERRTGLAQFFLPFRMKPVMIYGICGLEQLLVDLLGKLFMRFV